MKTIIDRTATKAMGNRLAMLRKEKNVSQKVVAEHLGLPWRRYQTWEVGSRTPNYQLVMKVAEYFGVSPGWVATGLGSRLNHNQKATSVARATADRKLVASLS